MNKKKKFNLFDFLSLLGSKSGAIISISALISIGAAAGAFSMKVFKNIEILNIEEEFRENRIKLDDEIRSLKNSNYILDFKLEKTKVQLSDCDEQRKRK